MPPTIHEPNACLAAAPATRPMCLSFTAGVVSVCLTFCCSAAAQGPADVHMANGVKIGEVSHDSAVIWTRLTKNPQRHVDGHPFPEVKPHASQQAQLGDRGIEEMQGSAAGAAGEVRIVYWGASASPASTSETPWQAVSPDADFTRQFLLKSLRPGTRYQFRAEGRPGSDGERGDANAAVTTTTAGAFQTAPAAETPARVSFTVVTGQDYHRRDDGDRGHKIYPLMQALQPNFFVHTGDIEYYDRELPYATSAALARFKWNRLYAMPSQRAFHNEVASYFIKDDHDTLKDDCWPGQTYGDLTWEQGLALFVEQVPMGERTYRTIRWGRDLQIWMVEGRDFRSPNTDPDGPQKTIWGEEQKQWFFDTVEASDATFRILISPTPLVGPDRGAKRDNHANAAFATEGGQLREFIASQANMVTICGDRHWQYVSVDPATGVREYSCGPTSDAHAGGFQQSDRSPAHRYLKIKGGFLSVVVDRANGKPTAIFRHYGVDGQVYNEDILVAE